MKFTNRHALVQEFVPFEEEQRLYDLVSDYLERQRATRTLEAKREEAWRAYDQAGREIDRQKDALLDEISNRLEQTVEQTPLFTIRWSLA